MGKRKGERQEHLWVSYKDLPETPGHPFYRRVGSILAGRGFDAFVEGLCAPCYAEVMGRPSIPPGVYFRMLMVGYFEKIDSERGIAWRCADSLCLREFLGYGLDEKTPDHSTVSRTRRLLSLETHVEVFTWVLKVLAEEGLLDGGTLGVDATMLEANAAMRSIQRRDTGEGWKEFLTSLAKASGIETPTAEDLRRIDKERGKGKASNEDWEHPDDPDARIAKMKDGRTHMAHKAEHAVDLKTDAVVAVGVHPADEGDTSTIWGTLAEACENLRDVREAMQEEAEPEELEEEAECLRVEEVVTDKGYHSNDVMRDLSEVELRSYVSEPDRGRRRWKGKEAEREAVYANRRRMRGERGKDLLKKRGEYVERTFAHLYDSGGGMRRLHLRGRENIWKRLLIHAAGRNLSLVLRRDLGAGTPRGVTKGASATCVALFALPEPPRSGFDAGWPDLSPSRRPQDIRWPFAGEPGLLN